MPKWQHWPSTSQTDFLYYRSSIKPLRFLNMQSPIVILKCRICLGEHNEGTMFPLFDSDGSDENDAASNSIDANYENHNFTHGLGEKVEQCSGIKVRQLENLPSKICERCFEFVRMWYKFREMCLNSQVYLESSCLDPEKPNDFIDASDTEYLDYLYETLQTGSSPPPTKLSGEYILTHINDTLDGDGQVDMETDYVAEDVVIATSTHEFEESSPVASKTKSPDMLIAVIESYGGEDEVIIPNFQEDSQSTENSIAINNDTTHPMEEEEQPHRSSNERYDDILSSTPSPDPQPNATAKRRPGRPRKADSALKSKRKEKDISLSQLEDLQSQYMCNFCGNVYQKKSSFTAHMASHSEHKPHQCEICHKAFRQVGELRAHIRRHTGERPFKCLYCERHFYDRSEKVRHERVHTNTRPYVCKVCGKDFTHTAILKNHTLVHSGEKNYSCSVCSKSFTLLHQLKAHLQTITHKSKEEQALAELSC